MTDTLRLIRTLTKAKPPTESKVYAASDAAGAGGVLVVLITWAIGAFLYKVGAGAEDATKAIAAVAAPLSLALAYFVPKGLSYWAGYRTPHTPRPDLERVDDLAAELAETGLTTEQVGSALPGTVALASTAAETPPRVAVSIRDLPAGESGTPAGSHVRQAMADADGDGHDDATGRFVKKTEPTGE